MKLKVLLTVLAVFGLLALVLTADTSSPESTSRKVKPPPTVTAPLKVYWGARADGEVYNRSGDAPWDSTTWDLFQSHAGKQLSIVHWGQPFGALDTNALNLTKARGAVSLISIGLSGTLASIANGSQDATIDAFAQKAKSFGYPILLRPWWEMNGSWFAWGRSSDYIAAWRRYVTRIRAIAPNVSFVWCPNTIWDSASDIAPYFPGDEYIDWAGIDGYNRNEPWTWAGGVFDKTLDRIKQLSSKPVMIAETGSYETGGDKAAWITNFLSTWIPNHSRVRAVVWFNWNILENGVRREWPIETSLNAQTAFKNSIANSRYLTQAPQPWLSKLPLP